MKQDHETTHGLKAGRWKAMELLFARYYKPLVVYADAYLHDLCAAEDLVQDQFVKLCSRDLFQNNTMVLHNYLYTVVKNAAINELERRKVLVGSLTLSHFQIAQREAERLDAESVALVRAALLKLPEKTRRVVESVMLHERMYQETADELGISVNTVKTHLRNGIKELRELLDGKQDVIFLFFLRKGVADHPLFPPSRL